MSLLENPAVWRTVWTVLVGGLAVLFDTTIVAVALQTLARELNAESRYFFLTSVVDELRFTGPHSNYFSQFLFELWGQDVSDPEELDIRQQIARILLERFSGFWPQPWSLVYATLDLLRNEKYMFFDQPFIKEQSLTIQQLISQKVAKLGENISVRRFARFKVGDPSFTVASAKVSTTEEAQA